MSGVQVFLDTTSDVVVVDEDTWHLIDGIDEIARPFKDVRGARNRIPK